jgi:hypothetical protein
LINYPGAYEKINKKWGNHEIKYNI